MNAPMPAADTSERTDARALRVEEVRAQWLQNVGAGLGAATIVALLAWATGATMAYRWPLIVGGCVFGAGMLLRAFVDEFRAERNWRKREQEHDDAMIAVILDLEDAEAERDVLRDQWQAARAEANRLSNELASARYQAVKGNESPRHVAIQDTFSAASRADARELLRLWYASGAWPGERTTGWTRNRHSVARDLLQRCGVLRDAPTNAAQPPENEAWALDKMGAWLGDAALTPHRTLEVATAPDAPESEETA